MRLEVPRDQSITVTFSPPLRLAGFHSDSRKGVTRKYPLSVNISSPLDPLSACGDGSDLHPIPLSDVYSPSAR